MMSRVSIFIAALIAGVLLASCSSAPPPSKTVVVTTAKVVGPPPHAPAHGYRHKHTDGVELVYHSGMKVYLVTSASDHYYWKGNYYRRRGGQWQLSANLRGPWRVASKSKLPAGFKVSKRQKVRATTSN